MNLDDVADAMIRTPAAVMQHDGAVCREALAVRSGAKHPHIRRGGPGFFNSLPEGEVFPKISAVIPSDELVRDVTDEELFPDDKPVPFSVLYASAARHINAFLGGEIRDPKSGLLHISLACINLMFIETLLLRGKGKELDDLTQTDYDAKTTVCALVP